MVRAEWALLDGGEVWDSLVDFRPVTYFRASRAGSYRLVAQDARLAVSDTFTIAVGGGAVPPSVLPIAPAAEPGQGAPELPRTFLDTRYQAPSGRTLTVARGGNLQAALDSARRGDVVELAQGVVFRGNFVLPSKPGAGWITIRSAGSLPPEGSRVTPASARHFARLETPNSQPALRTAAGPGVDRYRIMGIELTSSARQTYAIAYVGGFDGEARTVAELPSEIVFDRVMIQAGPQQQIQRCLVLNGRASAVIESRLAGCHAKGLDSQAIIAWNSPGPFKIVNNYLEGAGENVMFGGADPRIEGLVPSDIEFRRNHLYKPLSWKNSGSWTVKNLFELKNAQRVLVEGNIMENNWLDGQTGFAVVLKSANQSAGCNWCVVQDVTFRYNVIANSPGGVSLMATQTSNGGTAVPANDLAIAHNLFRDVAVAGQEGAQRRFQMLGRLSDVVIEHNTALGDGSILVFDGEPAERLVFEDNLLTRGTYGVIGTARAEGNAALRHFAPGAVFRGNVLIGARASAYPAGNNFPESFSAAGVADRQGDAYLAAASAYAAAGSDGTPPGVDLARLTQETAGVR